MPAPPVSPDGRWWWDGRQWRSRVVEGELDPLWPASTPEWLSRILLTGLIGLIPVVGTMVLYGWTLALTDMLRQRWKELPAPGFEYLRRGVAPFAVSLLYGLAVLAAGAILAGLAILLGVASRSLVPLAVLLGFLAALVLIAGWLLGLYLLGAILVTADRLPIESALNPRTVWRVARANHEASLRAGLTYLAGIAILLVLTGPVTLFVPFAGWLVSLALPALFAALAPALARFEIPGLG